MRFSVYNHKLVLSDGTLIERKFIVIRDELNLVSKWTDFHKYIVSGHKVRKLESENSNKFNNIVQLLNYAFFDEYHIKRLTDLNIEIVKSFLIDYGLCKLKNDNEDTHRSKQTVEKCVYAVSSFIEELCKDNPEAKIKPTQLYKKVQKFSRQRKRYIETKEPVFEIYYRETNRQIFRDIPEEAFQIIFNRIYESHPRILMLAALGAFAGLRPSEACCVRREDSKLGSGIRFEKIDGEVVNIYIDLTKEFNLRSDFIKVGGIKKERVAQVYPRFIPAFLKCYKRYMKFIEGKPYEAQYGPLTINKRGKAMIYKTYFDEFKTVVKECIPELLQSNIPKAVIYGQLLLENELGTHIWRHFFSCKLVLYGESLNSLQYWRGDKDVQSSLNYINNKSDIAENLHSVMDSIFDFSLKMAEKLHEDNN